MRQVWITGPGDVDVRDVPEPRPEHDEVLVSVAYAGLCGSDIHTVRSGHPWLPYPIRPGHEGSGVVVEVGSKVTEVSIGDQVYINPVISCGVCSLCRVGRTNLCEKLIGIGSHRPGLMSDLVALPSGAVTVLPEGMSLTAGALVEPFATCVHAAAVARVEAGRLAVVIGAGSIGQSMSLTLGDLGCEVVVVDPVESKRALALANGATSAFAALDDVADFLAARGTGVPHYIFDCVAKPATLGAAVRLGTPGGVVVAVGVGTGSFSLDVETLQDREVLIAGSAMYVPNDFVHAERLASSDRARSLITSVCDLSDAAEVILRKVSDPDQIKVLFTGPAGA